MILEYLIILGASFIASGLTLFSGFGLGTILVPVFGMFFPIELAIGLTAIVHFLNNCFKLVLLGSKIDWKVVIQFGLPATLFSFIGAYSLTTFSEMPTIYNYQLAGHIFSITPVKMIIGSILIIFALFEIYPKQIKIQINSKHLPFGGALSGFFGGLSGHQGALRSVFLAKMNLRKETFIATGVMIACIIDVSRLSIYSKQIFIVNNDLDLLLITLATLSAFSGAFLGNKLLKKSTFRSVNLIVTIMLLLFSVLLVLGMI